MLHSISIESITLKLSEKYSKITIQEEYLWNFSKSKISTLVVYIHLFCIIISKSALITKLCWSCRGLLKAARISSLPVVSCCVLSVVLCTRHSVLSTSFEFWCSILSSWRARPYCDLKRLPRNRRHLHSRLHLFRQITTATTPAASDPTYEYINSNCQRINRINHSRYHYNSSKLSRNRLHQNQLLNNKSNRRNLKVIRQFNNNNKKRTKSPNRFHRNNSITANKCAKISENINEFPIRTPPLRPSKKQSKFKRIRSSQKNKARTITQKRRRLKQNLSKIFSMCFF